MGYAYRICADSGYIYRCITEGERFSVCLSEKICASGRVCRVPRLLRENGGAPDEISFFPGEGDAVHEEFLKKRRTGSRLGGVFAVTLLVLLTFGVVFLLELAFDRPTQSLVIALSAAVLGAIYNSCLAYEQYVYKSNNDYISLFCEEESYLPHYDAYTGGQT